MIRILIFIVIISISYSGFGQIDNKRQHDTIYSNQKVKMIFVYLNSPRDLSKIIELKKNGNIKRIEKYSASYNRRTRKTKKLNLISHYSYNPKGLLIKITDSTLYYNNTFSIDSTVFKYDSISRKSKKTRYKRGYETFTTKFSYNPFITTTIKRNDSIIMYYDTEEYDRNFYVSKSYGYNLQPKRKKDTINGFYYSDETDLQRFEFNKTLKNTFDKKGQLIKSDVNIIFMNDRKNEYQLYYKYNNKGLLKSIRGYVPRYYEYEYSE